MVGVVVAVVGAVVGGLLVGALVVGALVVAVGLLVGDAVGERDGGVVAAGEGEWPRAGATGFGETTRWPAGASRTAASATVPATAARPTTPTVACLAPNLRNSVRRRSARSAGRAAL